MKVTSVELHPDGSSQVVVLSFRDPRALNPYNVVDIQGLDADEIASRFYSGSGDPTKRFYNLTLPRRDIVISMGLNPNFTTNQTYSDLRDAIYKMIASSRTGLVQVQFKNGTTIVAISSGFISKIDAPQFVKDPKVALTIKLKDPLLKSPASLPFDFTGALTSDFNLADPNSTAPHGMFMRFRTILESSDFRWTDLLSNWFFRIVPDAPFEPDDMIYIYSELNNKAVYVIRGGVTTYLADKIEPGSVWPVMFPGDNHFKLDNPTKFHIEAGEYTPTYWGV